MATKNVKITTLTPDSRNANKGTQRGLRALDDSLRQLGAGRSILVDKAGRVIAGNKTLERAADIGMEDVIIVESDGTKLIAVKRTDLDLDGDDGKARKLAYADNRIGELDLDWDVEQIALDLAAGLDLSGIWDEGELADLGIGIDDADAIAAGTRVFSDDAIIEAAFPYFRKLGFPYHNLPVHVCMQEINKLAETEPEQLLRTNTAYQVADTYHPHRFHASAEGMKSPIEAFVDDGLLLRALRFQAEYGMIPGGYFTSIKFVSGTQACANFRPGFACYLYRKYAKPGDVVLDCSTGYGGRLVGFMASGCGRYIGIDPNVPTHEGNLRMAADLGFADRVELYNSPAEDVPHDALKERCDFAFTSPPYFAKEHYSADDTQSWVRYKTGEEWRDGFLVPFMALQFAALKPGSVAIVNIADVKLRGKVYPLERWAVDAGKSVGFVHLKTDSYKLTHRVGAGQIDEVATEPVIVFVKSDNQACTN